MKKLKKYCVNYTSFDMEEHKFGEYIRVLDVNELLLNIREALVDCKDDDTKAKIKSIIQECC